MTKRGHTGTIYRAHNAVSLGRGSKRTLWLMPDGRIASECALSKLRAEDSGREYAERMLRDAGAPSRELSETGSAWVLRLKTEGFLRALAHPGNLRFGWRTDGKPLVAVQAR